MLFWSHGFTAKESHGRGGEASVLLSPQVCYRYSQRLGGGNPPELDNRRREDGVACASDVCI